jgi:galactose mutarotase-like enzyme
MLYRYSVDGTPHHMPLHGFGFASEFGVKSVTANSASLVLRETTASQVLFPFMFELHVNFKIEATFFEISTEIIHKSPTNRQKKHPMPIAMGWHPYLKVHNVDSASVSLPSSMYYSVTQSGAAGKSALVSEFGPPPWPIKKPLLNSLIFSDLDPSKEASFNNGKDSEKNIKLAFGPPKIFNHIVVWSNNLEEFYCVEPWMSLPDAVSTPSGCIWLKPEDSLKNWIRISI